MICHLPTGLVRLLAMQFEKYHALGNDYLVLDPVNAPELPTALEIRKICHRNFGLGSDGILYGPLPTEEADFALRILNPDGSEAEKSGNGLRIFARYLFDHERVSHAPFTVKTYGGIVTCQIDPETALITVDMGQVSFDAQVIPVEDIAGEAINFPLALGGTDLSACAATIGNPHCVILREQVSSSETCALGPAIENHPRFPNRTNVQFLQVIDRKTIQIEIWERGAGYTLASGSSSSAAGAVARRLGLVDADILVRMPGGNISLHIDSDYAVRMTGPATRVGTYVLAEEVLSQSLPEEQTA